MLGTAPASNARAAWEKRSAGEETRDQELGAYLRRMGTLFTSRRILLTGASRGIGREAAVLLARAGHRLVLVARDADALADTAAEARRAGAREEPTHFPLDVTDAAAVAAGCERWLASGPIDVVVNNAGSCNQGAFLHQRPSLLRAELEVNYWGAVNVCRALLPSMLRRRSGLIVNVSSLLGSVASPTTACYGASKAALEAWSYALRAELARTGVGVTVFVAPHTDTPAGRTIRFKGVKSLPVAYTARELVRAIDRAPRRYIGSPAYRLLLGMARLFPVFMEKQVGGSARDVLDEHPLLAEPFLDPREETS